MFSGRRRKVPAAEDGLPAQSSAHGGQEKHSHHDRNHQPMFKQTGRRVPKGIKPEGESGRKGVHPLHFFRICFRSTSTLSLLVNVLW